jgi:hypothetical protein
MSGAWTIVLSDTHLGEAQGVLTPWRDADDHGTARAVTDALARCLAALVRGAADAPPTLALNGDGLGLAFGRYEHAAADFGAFAARLAAADGPGLGAVLLVTGNHDHHLWEQARGERYHADVAAACGPTLPPEPPAVTPLDPRAALPHALLAAAVARAEGGRPVPVRIANPNVALRAADGERALLLHHGHHHEPAYGMVSRLLSWIFPERPPPATVAAVEAENHGWIDFVWSTLGRSGSAAEDVERSYEKLADPAAAAAELTNLVEDALGIRTSEGFLAGLERDLVAAAVRRAVQGGAAPAGPPPGLVEARQLARWLTGPVAQQLRDEWGGRAPRELLYACGHTHRPYERAGAPGSPFVWNTGGWVVETERPDETHGASLIVADGDANAAVVRLYDEAPRGSAAPGATGSLADGVSAARVAALWTRADEGGRRFAERVRDVVRPDAGPWRAFRVAAGAAVAVRRERLWKQIVS